MEACCSACADGVSAGERATPAAIHTGVMSDPFASGLARWSTTTQRFKLFEIIPGSTPRRGCGRADLEEAPLFLTARRIGMVALEALARSWVPDDCGLTAHDAIGWLGRCATESITPRAGAERRAPRPPIGSSRGSRGSIWGSKWGSISPPEGPRPPTRDLLKS